MLFLACFPDARAPMQVHDYGQLFHIFVEDVDGAIILHHEPFLLKEARSRDEHNVNFTVRDKTRSRSSEDSQTLLAR